MRARTRARARLQLRHEPLHRCAAPHVASTCTLAHVCENFSVSTCTRTPRCGAFVGTTWTPTHRCDASVETTCTPASRCDDFSVSTCRPARAIPVDIQMSQNRNCGYWIVETKAEGSPLSPAPLRINWASIHAKVFEIGFHSKNATNARCTLCTAFFFLQIWQQSRQQPD